MQFQDHTYRALKLQRREKNGKLIVEIMRLKRVLRSLKRLSTKEKNKSKQKFESCRNCQKEAESNSKFHLSQITPTLFLFLHQRFLPAAMREKIKHPNLILTAFLVLHFCWKNYADIGQLLFYEKHISFCNRVFCRYGKEGQLQQNNVKKLKSNSNSFPPCPVSPVVLFQLPV